MAFHSWGRYPRTRQSEITLHWKQDFRPGDYRGSVLAVGQGRSYGDVCLNEGNTIVLTNSLNRFLDFNPTTGILRCEAGVSFSEILHYFVPRGWFPPVTPGTKFVSIGGAIANDVHGKNHHIAGTFGRWVRKLELLRSDGRCLQCSPNENPDLFAATIAGMGLTGLITEAEIQLRPIVSRRIALQSVKFQNIAEFLELSREFSNREYVVSWADCASFGSRLGRGIFMAGDHQSAPSPLHNLHPRTLSVPVDAPAFLLNRFTIKAFNSLYYARQRSKQVASCIDYEPFFYPLDFVLGWNRLYGKDGFTQFQCCVPLENSRVVLTELLKRISKSGLASCLAVLKVCGNVSSPGLMSFPFPGVTLALDFPVRGEHTQALLSTLNQLTAEAGGRVYPAKDAFMTPSQFRTFYPQVEAFAPHIDPAFSSSFWRRVSC